MERTEIIKRMNDAKAALKSSHPYAVTIQTDVKTETAAQYIKNAWRIFDEIADVGAGLAGVDNIPTDAAKVIGKIREAQTVSTLRMHAHSVRYVAMLLLRPLYKQAEAAQREKDWAAVECMVSMPQFTALTKLCELFPSDYRNPILPDFAEPWEPSKMRKSKKTSLHRLSQTWREEIAAHSLGQFRLPAIICLLTGCRPAEIKTGILVERIGKHLYVTIQGAKVKEYAGQKQRRFRLAQHPLKELLSDIMKENAETKDGLLIQVETPNSVTTHMRAVGKMLWPQHKESITCYTARHAMAADCKQAIAEGADPDLVSQVLGHVVDKTASYYGNRYQSGGRSMVPLDVTVTKQIKYKSRARNEARKSNGEIPSKKQGNNKRAKKDPDVRLKNEYF